MNRTIKQKELTIEETKTKVIIEYIEKDEKLRQRRILNGRGHIDFWWNVLTQDERLKEVK